MYVPAEQFAAPHPERETKARFHSWSTSQDSLDALDWSDVLRENRSQDLL